MSQFRVTLGDWQCTDRERELVNEVLDSGRLSYGPKSREFEQEFARIHQCAYGVLSNSGTSSLQVALQAMKEIHEWEDGEEVIVPAVTFVATANIVLHNRMTPVLADVDPQTYNINPFEVGQAITGKTRAVIPVHLFGQPADMRTIEAGLNRTGIKIIEDSCECMFATHDERSVGSIGDIGCFSTYMAHLITTGVGGIATTSNPDYAVKMRSLVNHGRDSIYMDIDTESSQEVVERRFNFESVGHSFRVTEIEAAIGLAQLEVYEQMIRDRRANTRHLTNGLWHLDTDGLLQLPSQDPANTHSWMMYPIILREGDKLDLTTYLENNGIETRDMMPLTNQPVYKDLWDPEDYPVAQWINEQGFYIGCHQHLVQEDLDYVIDKIKEYFV